jgi:hypothetical protein
MDEPRINLHRRCRDAAGFLLTGIGALLAATSVNTAVGIAFESGFDRRALAVIAPACAILAAFAFIAAHRLGRK